MHKVWEGLLAFWRPALGGLLAAGIGAAVAALVVGQWPTETIVKIAIAAALAVSGLGIWAWKALVQGRKRMLEAASREQIWAEVEAGTGLIDVHSSLDAAITGIQGQIASSKRQYVFAQLGREVFHTSSKLNQIIFESERPDGVDLRILHASKTSRYLSRPVAIARGTDYDQWQIELNYMIRATPKVSDAGGRVRQHGEPFLWRLFIFDDLCFVQPYVAIRNNSKEANVLVFSRNYRSTDSQNPMSLYKIFEKYFEAIWEENTPSQITVRELDNNSGRLVVVGLIQSGEYTAWAVPHRYFKKENDTIRFNGIGGKIHIGEDPLTALQRELSEELNQKLQVNSAGRTIFASEGRVVTNVACTDTIKPIVINKFERYENLSAESVDYHLVAYACKAQQIQDLMPHNDLGAVIILSKSYLRRAVAGNLTIDDLMHSNDGSRINASFDLAPFYSRKLAPAGLALVYANETTLDELN
jgi:hypothetical protein